jgi:hypothetical protein
MMITSNKYTAFIACVISLLLTSTHAYNAEQVDFQAFNLDSPIWDIMWCGSSNENILAHTDNGHVYRSRDRGRSWKKIHSYLLQEGQKILEDGDDVGFVEWIAQSPHDDNLVVMIGK